MDRAAIERSLLEDDGSCRDINFSEAIPTTGAVAVLEVLAASWTLVAGRDAEGEAVPAARLREFLMREQGALKTTWTGPVGPRDLQAYFYWARPDEVFCELTFFPDALDARQFSLDDFISIVARFVRAAQSCEYYVRFENAAWYHERDAADSSIIFSHRTIPLPPVSNSQAS